jgi:hypothetical protein
MVRRRKWTKEPKKTFCPSFGALVGIVRKNRIPSFKSVYANAFRSETGKKKLADMIQALKGTPYDIAFCDAIRESGFLDRHMNDRNASDRKKAKMHPDAIDFGIGEQDDGAVNELRGAVVKKDGDVPWTPRADLKPEKDWRITDTRLLEAITEACKDRGPLAESADSRKVTTSTAHSRAAAFASELIACIISMHHDLEADLASRVA